MEKNPEDNNYSQSANHGENVSNAPEDLSKWGYDLYPERRGPKPNTIKDYLKGKGTDNVDKMRCERTLYQCIQQSPLVKLMMGALQSSGCAIDIRRHISCEVCDPKVSGGYDPLLNQIVICQNTVTKKGIMQGILTHEMIHMFDYCNNDMDFKNIDHLACTEVRAANLTHCSLISAVVEASVSPFHVKRAHRDCVREKAFKSVISVRDVTEEEAWAAIDRVFPKCYADLEPIGRRLKGDQADMFRAHDEGYLYGYN